MIFQKNNNNIGANKTTDITDTLQTDAAIVPQNNAESHDQNRSTVSLTSSEIPADETTNRCTSLTPLKEDALVQLSTANVVGNSTALSEAHPISPVLMQHVGNSNSYQQSNSLNSLSISHSTGVHVGNVTQISVNGMMNGNDPSALVPQQKRQLKNKKTKTINEMMQSADLLEHRTIDVIAEHLEKWKDVARKLGFSEGQIEHFNLDFHVNGTKEVIHQMLLDWSRNSDDATIGTITRVLWASNNFTTVHHLKEVWKKIRKPESSN